MRGRLRGRMSWCVSSFTFSPLSFASQLNSTNCTCDGTRPQSTIHAQITRELALTHGIVSLDRRAALQVARSLQSQLFFYEVEWGGRQLQDGVEDVYMFLDDQEAASGSGSGSESEARVMTSKERKENLLFSTLNIPRKERGGGGCTGYGDRNRNRNRDWDWDRDGRG